MQEAVPSQGPAAWEATQGCFRDSQRECLNSQHWSGRTASRQQTHGPQTPKIRRYPQGTPHQDGKLLTSSTHMGLWCSQLVVIQSQLNKSKLFNYRAEGSPIPRLHPTAKFTHVLLKSLHHGSKHTPVTRSLGELSEQSPLGKQCWDQESILQEGT